MSEEPINKVEQAVSCFNCGFNCSQAILSTYSESLGLDRETALKLSCSFGAGMGRLAGTCGAVTGALMLIGLKHGKYLEDGTVSKDHTYMLVRDFMQAFEARNGSTVCKELLACDISTPEGFAKARDNKYWDTYCVRYVRDAAELIEEMLQLK